MCNCVVVQNDFIVIGLWICALKIDNLCQRPNGKNNRFYNDRSLIKLINFHQKFAAFIIKKNLELRKFCKSYYGKSVTFCKSIYG